MLIASFSKKDYILAIGYEKINKRKSGEPMDEKKYIETIELLRLQPNEKKGFSFRRTIKTLQQARKFQIIEDYRKQLINAKAGVKEDAEPE